MSIGTSSLSSGSIFVQPLYALEYTSRQIESSVLKLSTGSRISRGGDDVAALSIATRLQSQLFAVKQASNNAAQGDSLLQVASGALQQIMDLLDRNDSIATQANTSSLSAADRSFLQTEFASNLSEIDRIAKNTTFNDIALLDGTLSGANKPTTTTAIASKATATLAFVDNPDAGETVIINGVTFTEGSNFTRGLTVSATIDSLISTLQASTDARISKASYTRSGDSLVITAKAGGDLGETFTINQAGSSSNFITSGAPTQTTNIYTLEGGAENGLSIGSVVSSGTIGDAIVNTQSQTKANVTLTLSSQALNNEVLNIDNGNAGLLAFTFKDTASAATDIQIGATIEETLQNAAKTISQYSGTSNFVTRQLDLRVDGNSLILSNKVAGNPYDFANAVPDITETLTGGALSAATITGGTNTGINTDGVTNSAFVGQISGFTASYVSADSVNASITVGDSTYTASITDTTPSSNTTVRFSSTDGGYFDVQLAASQGQAVTNTTDSTNAYAARLNAAIEGLTFYQSRTISDFAATGAFVGASAKLQQSDFTDVKINSISVTAPPSSGYDATIDITINDEIYRASSGIRGSIGAYEAVKFTSLSDPNKVLTLNNGSTAKDFSDATSAATFESNLRNAFGLNRVGSGLSFQVGESSGDRFNVVVSNSTIDQLFNGTSPSVATQDDAAAAQTLIDTARDAVLSSLSTVGAYQARFQSAQALNAKIIEGVTAARSGIADTDIAEESTNYALATVRLNAGISVVAQTQKLQSSLLSILQAGQN